MSTFQEAISNHIKASPKDASRINNQINDSIDKCKELELAFKYKFFPDGKEIKVSENFAYNQDCTAGLFREAILWWNANKPNLGNQHSNRGINMTDFNITMYICKQIKNLEKQLEEHEIEIGDLNLDEYLSYSNEEILSRNIDRVLNLGDDELPDVVVPDATANTKDISEESPQIEELNENDEVKINKMVEEMIEEGGENSMFRGRKFEYNGRIITVMDPVEEDEKKE
jgi:hypothetical protein